MVCFPVAGGACALPLAPSSPRQRWANVRNMPTAAIVICPLQNESVLFPSPLWIITVKVAAFPLSPGVPPMLQSNGASASTLLRHIWCWILEEFIRGELGSCCRGELKNISHRYEVFCSDMVADSRVWRLWIPPELISSSSWRPLRDVPWIISNGCGLWRSPEELRGIQACFLVLAITVNQQGCCWTLVPDISASSKDVRILIRALTEIAWH